LRQAAFYLRPGQDVTLRVHRDGQDVQLTLHVGEMPLAVEPKAPAPATADAGPKPDPAGASLIPGVSNPDLPPPPVVKTK
jgi:hypothetical protein